MTRLRRHSNQLLALIGLILAVLIVPASVQANQDETSYGFVRVIDGRADLMQASSNTLIELVENYPLMVGDEMRIPYGSRAEAVLPDGTYLRLDGDSELNLQRLALSADSEDQISVLRLLRGEVQLVLPSDTASSEAFRIDTLNASVYLQNRGTYRIRTDGLDWSEIVVREGFAEVVTEQGSSIVRSGEQTIVEGQTSPDVRVERAGARDELERWGDDLLAQVGPADSRNVDPALAYASAPLARSGHWVSVGGRSAWRPYVAAGWRPYHAGWWTHTPSGLTWVSTEPWGWVTYHYGGWDLAPGWGWVWYPGPVYTPASVFWYWGPTYVGWVPRPYYTHYYWPHRPYSLGFGFHHGVFGWAGGRPHHWAHWTFSKHRHFGHHGGRHASNYGRHHYTGAQLRNTGALKEVPRGVVAADTRALTPALWNRPTEAMRVLAASRVDANGNRVAGELPDVTSWVARSRQLSPQVEQAVMPRQRRGSGTISAPEGSGGAVVSRRTASISPPASRAGGGRMVGPDRSGSAAATSPTRSSALRPGQPRADSVRIVSPSAGTRASASTGAPDWRDRRSLGPRPSATDQTPATARRVWDGVRSYRERSRQDTSTSVRPTYRSSRGGMGSSPGYGVPQTQRSWTQRPTSSRYFGGFGSSPGYGGSRSSRSRPPAYGGSGSSPGYGGSQGSRSRPPAYRGSGSSPGYGRPQGQGVQSRSGLSRPGSTSSRSSVGRRAAGSSPHGGRSSAGSARTRGSGASRGSSSPPPR